ncbi:SCO1664 family protein [Nocardia callitridis]|uniref:SCO1664 family protein n=1 Tax=Nocardia callitridis TaxID=648753 RepID=A0ABP9K729_9NOCA
MAAETGTRLREGELTVIGRITTASNVTLVCEIAQDAEVEPLRVVYKPIRGERPLWDFPDGTLADREVASYLVSHALGWEVIPETVLREGPYGSGMVQRWIDSVDRPDDLERLDLVDLCRPDAVPDGFREVLRALDPEGEEVALVHADDPRLRRMAVLDVLLNNADRKGGHILEAADGGVYGVDHGICLHTEPKLRTVLWGWVDERIEDTLLADITTLGKELRADLGDTMAAHLTDAEIEALAARTQRLSDDPVLPAPNTMRPIPWPAF